MALTAGTIFETRASATTANVNGAGFNPANANFLTDLATDANTANTSAPVVSSVTYNFVAGDAGAYVYVSAGTSWQPGWYPIASVASNKATLDAAIGSVVLTINSQGLVTRNTVVGCTSDATATLTGGTFGVDYSQQNTAVINAVADFNAVGASTTLTSATAGFTPVMVGNLFHQTTTGTGAFGTVGWYEIVSYTNATTVVLDRAPNGGTASVNTTGYVGGAGRLNGLEDAFFEMIPAASVVWIKGGTYTTSGSISVASTNATSTNPSFVIGYNSLRGDTCNGSNRPVLAMGANALTWGQHQILVNLSVTSTNAASFSCGTGNKAINCRVFNSSSTASRVAFGASGSNNTLIACEGISQNGIGIQNNTNTGGVFGCYIHDSTTGISGTAGASSFLFNIFEACLTTALSLSSNAYNIIGNTIYGREAKMGTGINLSAANPPHSKVIGNIFYGLTTGITVNGATDSNLSFYNDFYNNTTDVSSFKKGPTDLALDPQFTGATQITGTTATTSGSVLTQSGGDFSTVTDNVDFVQVLSGTGVTVGNYLITSHTGTALTVNNALGTSSGGDVVYYVTTGHNFAVGTNLKAAGFPSFTGSGSETTGYMDLGAVQRQEAGGSSGMLFIPCLQAL
jgi:hypothetical protein